MRRYREDSERIIKLQSGTYVRRPQAAPFRVTLADHLKDVGEVLLGLVVLTTLFLGLPLSLYLLAASPAEASRPKPYITVNQGEQIIYGEWFTVSYYGSDYARANCTQDGQTVWSERVYLPGEGGPVQITPEIPYRAGTYTPCRIDLVAGKRERVLASDTFQIRAPV